ncbi:MAG: tetratricopeptide repeat protein [Promethearchaeota archaeon]|nr:MAG: tetratricopeptide repeat protein [Candidatus Lokiarchaeota archaeon]
MHFCPYCKKTVRSEWSYCHHCNKPLIVNLKENLNHDSPKDLINESAYFHEDLYSSNANLKADSSLFDHGIIEESLNSRLEKIDEEIETKLSQGKSIGNLLLEKSSLFYLNRDYETCLKILETALNNFIAENDDLNSAITFNEIGLIQEDLGFFDNAIYNFEKALEFLINLKDHIKLIKVYNNLANVYRLLNDLEYSYEYYEKALRVAENENYISEEIKTSSNLVEILFLMGDFDKIERILRRNLEYFNSIADPYGMVITLSKLGKLNYLLGPSKYKTALKFFKESLELTGNIEIGDHFTHRNKGSLEWESLLYLGKIKLSWKIYEEAKIYLLKSLEAMRNIKEDNDYIEEGIVLENLGILFEKVNDKNRSIQYYKLAADLYYRFGEDAKQADIKTKIARIYLNDKGDGNEAINYLEEALDIYRDLNYMKESAEILEKLGDVYANQNSTDIAISYFQEAKHYYGELLDNDKVKFLDSKIKLIMNSN